MALLLLFAVRLITLYSLPRTPMNDATKLLKLRQQSSMSAYIFSRLQKLTRLCYWLLHLVWHSWHCRRKTPPVPIGVWKYDKQIASKGENHAFFRDVIFFNLISPTLTWMYIVETHYRSSGLSFLFIYLFIYLIYLFNSKLQHKLQKTLKESIKDNTEGDDVCYKYVNKKRELITITKYNILRG